jgi:exosortase/archaeosortase family protein
MSVPSEAGMVAQPPSTLATTPRIVAGLLLIAVAVALILQQSAFRIVEAKVVAVMIDWFTRGHAVSNGYTIFFGLGTHEVHGIAITTLCSSVILVTPLLALGGVELLFRRFSFFPLLLGLVGALVLAVLCNVVRYVLAAIALQDWGTEGFELIHHWLGSLLVIFGFAVSFLLLLWAGARRTRSERPPRRLARHAA